MLRRLLTGSIGLATLVFIASIILGPHTPGSTIEHLVKRFSNMSAITTTPAASASRLSRTVFKAVYAIETSEGVGAKVRRSIGTPALRNLSPFLMLDQFSVAPGAGFPDHPHRGQTTVTYMLAGKNQHEDITGNKGLLEPGDVQWMTAGRGIVHSEMPYFDDPNPETAVRAEGMQLWVDLPEDKKFCEPSYQEKKAAEIDTVRPSDGVSITVISGESHGITGFVRPVGGCWFMDFKLSRPGAEVFQPLPEGWTAFAYIIKGSLSVGDAGVTGADKVHAKHHTLVLSTQPGQNGVLLRRPAGTSGEDEEDTHFVLVAGEPLDQRVVQYGPFVVNTAEQARQAVMDYQLGQNGFEGAPGWRSEIGKAMRH